ncbi:MAG TPA: hypothetical protein VKX17_24075 [Planctomycetota bacterium]|nr:hypothetical protein [Planctomycetota bacterium]
MVTTLDLPDDVLQRATLKAAREGVTLKEFVARTLEKNLEPAELPQGVKPWEALRGSGTAEIVPEESPWEYDEPPPHDPIWEPFSK